MLRQYLKIQNLRMINLSGQQTCYSWDNFIPSFHDTDVGVGQESALSLLLSYLYISPAMWGFEKKPSVSNCSIIIYVDNGTCVMQGDNFHENNVVLGKFYHFFVGFLTGLSLIVDLEVLNNTLQMMQVSFSLMLYAWVGLRERSQAL